MDENLITNVTTIWSIQPEIRIPFESAGAIIIRQAFDTGPDCGQAIGNTLES